MAGFLRTVGSNWVDEDGDVLRLRGVGIGNWLLPEGYMWRLPAPVDRPRRIEQFVADLAGEETATAFWRSFRDNFITEDDVAELARDGFNSLRLPLNARTLLDPAEIALVDRLIGWCREHGVYVILDLHGAPGGQTGTNIDDSEHDQPELFQKTEYADLTVELWRALADRYADEWIVAGYDLLNEPLPEWFSRYNDQLLPLYRRITEAIRSVDSRHTVILEGAHWATDWSIFTEPIDDNLVLEFHKYWNNPDRESLAPYLAYRDAWDVPIFMGEGGENNTDWYAGAFRLYDDLDISWNFWTWKKLDTTNSPLSIRPPEGWSRVLAEAESWPFNGHPPAISPAEAQEVFLQYAENVASDRCDRRPDVTRALFRRPTVRIPAAFYVNAEAGVGFRTPNPEENPHFRSGDRMPMAFPNRAGTPSVAEVAPSFQHGGGEAWGSQEWIGVRLDPGAWVAYDVTIPDTARYPLTVRFHGEEDALVVISVEGRATEASGVLSAGENSWTTSLPLEGGSRRIVIRGADGHCFLLSLTVGVPPAEV